MQAAVAPPRAALQPRPIQHKKEAFWFYRFLSIFYDRSTRISWTEEMREEALEPANLCDRRLRVVDVGGGTGYSTLGIVRHVDAENVTLLDQSVHQLAKARQKEALKRCTIIQGDAEDLPFPTDYADRYVSAGRPCPLGETPYVWFFQIILVFAHAHDLLLLLCLALTCSIEYWPEPQRGIKEAYRVLNPGGIACVIGPVYPTFWLSRFFADIWMLFPKEEEYMEWFQRAGFEDVKLKRICPSWYRGVRRHGLVMGCSVTGVKRAPGDSPLTLGRKVEDVSKPVNPLSFLLRFIIGLIGAGYFVLVALYMWIKDRIFPTGRPI